MLPKRDAAQVMYPPGRAARGKMCYTCSRALWREAEPGAGIQRNVAARLPVERRYQHSTVMARHPPLCEAGAPDGRYGKSASGSGGIGRAGWPFGYIRLTERTCCNPDRAADP
jgi:hypothetical protein